MRRGVTVLLRTMAAILLLTGCATGPVDDSEGPAATVETTISPPAFAGGTGRQLGEGSGEAGLVLVDVRVAEAEGFDRIVLEFSGTGTPGWVVNYVDDAHLEGSGEIVALRGSATLDIYASDTTWPAPDYYRGPRRLAPEDADGITEVYVGGTFEGYTQVLAGIDGDPARFRVFALTAPSRLVIDVADGVGRRSR